MSRWMTLDPGGATPMAHMSMIHRCELPQSPRAGEWTCPICGERWVATVMHLYATPNPREAGISQIPPCAWRGDH